MMNHNKSLISAHHNYMVSNMLSPGFVMGDPDSSEDFYFLADIVLQGESSPRISARLFDKKCIYLAELSCNRIIENPGKCSYHSIRDGFQILHPSGEPMLEIHTKTFTNGYLTYIHGRLYDRTGKLRMKKADEDLQVHTEDRLVLDAPFKFSR